MLKVAETDLKAARSHALQFQEISQASEAALTSLTTAYDDYKSISEEQIVKYEVTEYISPCIYKSDKKCSLR